LLSNPHVLVFDEPTSGLDSHNALNITRLLARLARQERKLVIATIHQPSTLIFREMDRLYLLNAGTRIFDGPAADVVPYMETVRVNVNYRMNPADFFMLEISNLKERTGYVTPLNSDNFDKHFPAPEVKPSSLCKAEIL
jgi:ATP-binding cassette subfamily G (WHITE) protein 2